MLTGLTAAVLYVTGPQSCCTDAGDLLPGLVVLSQQWLGEVVYPSFRGCENGAIPLQKWFDHPRVSLQLKVANSLRMRIHNPPRGNK